LCFAKGDIIVLLQRAVNAEWWEGYLQGDANMVSGLLPRHYVRPLEPHEAQFISSVNPQAMSTPPSQHGSAVPSTAGSKLPSTTPSKRPSIAIPAIPSPSFTRRPHLYEELPDELPSSKSTSPLSLSSTLMQCGSLQQSTEALPSQPVQPLLRHAMLYRLNTR
jgi:hypothetical protein